MVDLLQELTDIDTLHESEEGAEVLIDALVSISGGGQAFHGSFMVSVYVLQPFHELLFITLTLCITQKTILNIFVLCESVLQQFC